MAIKGRSLQRVMKTVEPHVYVGGTLVPRQRLIRDYAREQRRLAEAARQRRRRDRARHLGGWICGKYCKSSRRRR